MLLLLIRVFLILTLRIGAIEQYHPRQQLQWQLFRILMLYMLNLYTLIFALFGKVRKMVRPTKYRQRQRNYTSLKKPMGVYFYYRLFHQKAITESLLIKVRCAYLLYQLN